MKINKSSVLLASILALTTLVGCNKNNTSTSSSSIDVSSDTSNSSGDASSDSGSEINLVSISLNKTATNIMIGSTETLTVTFNPANATAKGISWSSSNTAVASVANGVVTANKVGTTVITATSTSNSSITASCTVTVKDNVVLASIDNKAEFVAFEKNRTRSELEADGFYDHEQTYKVGDDNPFNVKPVLTVVDATTYLPVSASSWNYDFTITAKMDGNEVGEQYFKVLDPRECNVQFTEAAVGHSFTISVAPGGVEATRVPSLTKSFTVDVVDGYNVYDAKELGYFDTRTQGFTDDTPIMENDKDWECKWPEFKTANNLRADYYPASLIFQKDIKVTTADLPANFFYTKAEAQDLNDAKAEGSLVDYTFLYVRSIAGDFTLDGNYFKLDMSEIPLIKRSRCNTTNWDKVVSHSAAFKTIRGGNINFRNLKMTGNAKNAADDNDKIYGGGLMFVKAAGSETLNASNIIATKFYITFFAEEPYYTDAPFSVVTLDKNKCTNNYNNFMYNWGTTMTASNSLFDSCGGPVLIQDHINTDVYEREHGLIIEGIAPTTNFVDCTFVNYVKGDEAWFQQFDATVVSQDIKMMSDLLYATGITKSFVTNDKHEGKLYQALALAEQNSYFNFIVLNKSGSEEGMTSVPNCGTVNITESDKVTTFNYRQPKTDDEVIQAYLAYVNAEDADKPAAQQALIAAASAKGVTFAPDYSDAMDKITAYITPFVTEHELLRGLNNASAPILDFGPAFDILSYDGKNNYLQTAANVAAEVQAGAAPAQFVPTSEQLIALPNYTALYYNGMALVMGITPYVA